MTVHRTSQLLVHCTRCAEPFMDTYTNLERFAYKCPECRAGMKPLARQDDEIVVEEEE